MATGDGNTELVQRLYGGLMAKGDTAVADEVLAEDYLDHDIPGVGEGGRQELVAAVLAVRAAVPDIAPTLGPILAEGDLVAVRVEAHGSTPAPRSRPASPRPARPSPGRKSTSSAAPAIASPNTGGCSTCSASSSNSAPSPPDPVLPTSGGHRSRSAPVVWPTSIRWPPGSRM
jgi:predicted SnoaL-like aldol condensation-catalyzing enzyme